ncbi:hypothetical protein SH528x_001947 [Novipirellula sp. SH528]|uniref:hypothetical protein n=1 Tax=Novipirellula sp. SH528 TaxID=3454466 RepID=UPI003F9ED652
MSIVTSDNPAAANVFANAPNLLDAFSQPPPSSPTPVATPFVRAQVAPSSPQIGLVAALSDPVLSPRILKAGSIALLKSLGLTAIVMIPGLILLSMSPLIGVLWMFVGSFFLMARMYEKPWRLTWITCVTPAAVSGLCFLIQLVLFRDLIPNLVTLFSAASIGVLIGLFRARSHSIYVDNGAVMAQRTVGYLVVWAICYGTTQMFGLFAATMPLIRGSLLASAFSTSMLICVSVAILIRYLNTRRTSSSAGSHPNVADAAVINPGGGQ